MTRAWVLGSETQRQFVASLIASTPPGWVVRLEPPQRSKAQNRLLHSALTDIAEQVTWKGQSFDVDTWKRLCTAAWLREIGEQPEMIPALDGKGFDILYTRTSTMTKEQMTSLLEWVMAFSAENGVVSSEPADGIIAR